MTPLERACIQHCLPGLSALGREMHSQLVHETHRLSGDLRDDAYASLDDRTGELEVGYDEAGRKHPHGFYYIFGTSRMEGDPALQRAVYRKYRDRNGDGS